MWSCVQLDFHTSKTKTFLPSIRPLCSLLSAPCEIKLQELLNWEKSINPPQCLPTNQSWLRLHVSHATETWKQMFSFAVLEFKRTFNWWLKAEKWPTPQQGERGDCLLFFPQLEGEKNNPYLTWCQKQDTRKCFVFSSPLPPSPAGVAGVSYVLCAQVEFSRCTARVHLLTLLCVCWWTCTTPLTAGASRGRGAEPRNCLTIRCKLCVYSEARVTLSMLGSVRLTCCWI